jgi:hypothetical protein
MKAIRMLSRWKRHGKLLGDCLTVTVDEYVRQKTLNEEDILGISLQTLLV